MESTYSKGQRIKRSRRIIAAVDLKSLCTRALPFDEILDSAVGPVALGLDQELLAGGYPVGGAKVHIDRGLEVVDGYVGCVLLDGGALGRGVLEAVAVAAGPEDRRLLLGLLGRGRGLLVEVVVVVVVVMVVVARLHGLVRARAALPQSAPVQGVAHVVPDLARRAARGIRAAQVAPELAGLHLAVARGQDRGRLAGRRLLVSLHRGFAH
jgi:hypothetical protein